MFKGKTKVIAAVLGVASTLLLAGCGNVAVVNANGAGSCGGNSFQLTTTQNTTGTNIEINYTGPDDVALFFVQGFYSDHGINITGDAQQGALGFGMDNDVVALRLETDQPGWTSSGSGANTTFHYSGDALTLIDARDTTFNSSSTTQADADLTNSLMPVVIGVDCDLSDQSDTYGPSQAHPTSDLVFEAASTVFPKEQIISPFEIISSTPITNGSRIMFRYTPEALSAFGSFTPGAPSQILLAKDTPTIVNDSIRHLWEQFLIDSDQPSASSINTNGDGTFTTDITGQEPGLQDGDYVLLALVNSTDSSDARWAFSSLHYEAARGFNVEDPFSGTPIGNHYVVGNLANTGSDSWLLAQMALGAIAVGAVLTLSSRRIRN